MAVATEEFIPLCVPAIQGNEWSYLKDCLDTNWVSSVGPFVDRFEDELSSFVGSEYAVATVNGTAALHISLLVAGVQADEEVLLPSLSFIAPANAIRYVGAWPIFIDVEPQHWQMDPEKVRQFLQEDCHWDGEKLTNKQTGRRIKAIMPVHILGHPVDMDPILELARQYKIVVIEDATESLGAEYKGQKVGTLGDIACFSFNGNKIITTGGGGMIVTDHKEFAERAKYLTTQAKNDPIESIHEEIGYNYRLTNLQAAMGVAQLELLPRFIESKRHIAQNYSQAFQNQNGLNFMVEASWAKSVFWLSTVLVDSEQYGVTRQELLKNLADHHVQTRPLWQPLHRSPAHQDFPIDCPVADKIHRDALSLPCSVGLDQTEQKKVIQLIETASRSL